MTLDDFMQFLEETGHQSAGLCMFAPVIISPLANRMLTKAYHDGGDGNLSVAMCRIGSEGDVRYIAGNYSGAPLEHVRSSIDVLERIPGAVVLITESGVGAQGARTLGLLENGVLKRFEDESHSFYSFSEHHLSVVRFDGEYRRSPFEDLQQKISSSDKIRFGTQQEFGARREFLAALENLDQVVAGASKQAIHGSIGHNQPPIELALPASISAPITLNVNIIRGEIISEAPDIEKALESTSALSAIGLEIIDFFQITFQKIKSKGSDALAIAIIGGIGTCVWQLFKWISALLEFPAL